MQTTTRPERAQNSANAVPQLVLAARIEVDVVDLDVRDDADRGVGQQERTVALVGLEEEEVAARRLCAPLPLSFRSPPIR